MTSMSSTSCSLARPPAPSWQRPSSSFARKRRLARSACFQQVYRSAEYAVGQVRGALWPKSCPIPKSNREQGGRGGCHFFPPPLLPWWLLQIQRGRRRKLCCNVANWVATFPTLLPHSLCKRQRGRKGGTPLLSLHVLSWAPEWDCFLAWVCYLCSYLR